MRQIRRRFIAGSNELRFYCAFCNYECYPVNNGEIFISLARKGRKVFFKVSNESEMIQKGNMDILFERFYRTDASRSSETGGSGIGLSVAKAIVEVHNGKIHAESADGKILVITVIL